ncbi:hypothetical protein G6F22_017387 [Rhizopus arrhizus]|nr:hypothetical protein G6F22_017387 [Rhizopus arrhizus]
MKARHRLGIGHGNHAGCAHSRLYPEDCQSRPVQWQGGDRRHRERARLALADELDSEPAAAFQEPAQGPDRGVGVFAVRGYSRRLREETDAGVQRRGDHPRVAVPPGRAAGRDRRTGCDRCEDGAGDDAVRDRVLHAAPGR